MPAPISYVPVAAAKSGADDFAGAVAARAAQQTAKKTDAIKPNPNTTTRNSSDINFASGQQKYTDTMQDKQFTKLVNDIRENGIKNPVIDYVEINGEAYIVKGNNRVRAAEYLGKNKELKYNKVDFPVEGTNFKTPQDVLDASTQNLRPPKYRGKGGK